MDDYLNETVELNEKIDKLKAIMNETKNVRMYKRYLVILMHLEGSTNVDIAKMVSLEQHAVGDYIKNYKVNGLAGLVMKHGTGAPRKLSKDQEVLIVETVTKKLLTKSALKKEKTGLLK